ncbi:hypothetical protein WOLCODRAFT_141980 [Wolfiporia cocos MD-104 SS10]|uniref:Uncharacterized protein n=1 Tax=Wolfiporia cocos (strain MD-104) TaxID=742152 RepID=A0A2H3J902_WOLCO|nr:hypothetical protein WOLCODRAFT_141980 [Wolfiporia cocos MD-104 SS10]
MMSASLALESDMRSTFSTRTSQPAPSLVIVSDLRAALEYDERMRARLGAASSTPSSAASDEPVFTGLPPPPRPRSKVNLRAYAASASVPASPLPGDGDARSMNGSLLGGSVGHGGSGMLGFGMGNGTGSGTGTEREAAAAMARENPYINPVPRLSFLLREAGDAAVLPGSASASEDEREGWDVVSSGTASDAGSIASGGGRGRRSGRRSGGCGTATTTTDAMAGARISISSTIYGSSYEGECESFIDLTSPTFDPAEAGARTLRGLPSTTNLLDARERAERVRKTRKLTQLLGQTPGVAPPPPVDVELANGCLPARRRHRPAASMLADPAMPALAAGRHLHPGWTAEDGGQHVFLGARRRSLPFSPHDLVDGRQSPTSFIDLGDDDPGTSPAPDADSDDERRRKRERLAKLHRFLGSRVPAHLVLGPLHDPARSPARRPRRRHGPPPPPPLQQRRRARPLDDLNGREKAINVRRAVKMEKSAYKGKSKKGRPATADSDAADAPLLPHAPGRGAAAATAGTGMATLPPPMSDIYLHYRHSLNSLNDIIDRDDRQSLAELHDYLSSGAAAEPSPPTSPGTATLSPPSSPPARRGERRRSLPSRTSIASISTLSTLSSVASLASPPLPARANTDGDDGGSGFQQRRRRAAKLTQFFGVNYRDLMAEILESIERGLEEERGRGTLKPDEMQDLLQKLVKLKTKRHNLS